MLRVLGSRAFSHGLGHGLSSVVVEGERLQWIELSRQMHLAGASAHGAIEPSSGNRRNAYSCPTPDDHSTRTEVAAASGFAPNPPFVPRSEFGLVRETVSVAIATDEKGVSRTADGISTAQPNQVYRNDGGPEPALPSGRAAL
jgi:hypothetical protein